MAFLSIPFCLAWFGCGQAGVGRGAGRGRRGMPNDVGICGIGVLPPVLVHRLVQRLLAHLQRTVEHSRLQHTNMRMAQQLQPPPL